MKTPTGVGIFVRKDKNGIPCYIGDTISVKVPQVKYEHDGYKSKWVVKGHRNYTGVLILRLSSGIHLKQENNKLFNRLKLTDNCHNPQEWTLIKHSSMSSKHQLTRYINQLKETNQILKDKADKAERSLNVVRTQRDSAANVIKSYSRTIDILIHKNAKTERTVTILTWILVIICLFEVIRLLIKIF
jgi:hypothetical protein